MGLAGKLLVTAFFRLDQFFEQQLIALVSETLLDLGTDSADL